MSGTSAKAHLLELLLEPLKGCKGLYNYRQDLMTKIMQMPDLQVRSISIITSVVMLLDNAPAFSWLVSLQI